MDLDPAHLLATDRRLRLLARELVGEGASAEDLAQETWLAALQRSTDIDSLPAWLMTVARRLAGRARRSRMRRAQREEHAAKAETIPSTDEILEREEARQRVVAAVLALEEPLRTTLVLRFLEDLPPRTVAARMQVPVELVRLRARKGIELLRAQLDRSFGERRSWMSVLVPWARLHDSSTAVTLAAMSIQTKVAVSIAVLALLAWFLWPREHGPASAASPRIASTSELTTSTPIQPANERGAEVGAPTDARSPAAPATAPAAAEGERTGSVRVHVSWSDHTDAAGVVVRASSREVENPELSTLEASTDDEGNAVFEDLPVGTAEILVDRHYAPPRAVAVTGGSIAEVRIMLLRGFDIAGSVEDEQGRPIGGAEIWLGKYPSLAHGTRIARSAADGSFRLRSFTHAYLGARARGYRSSKIEGLHAAEGAEVSTRLVLTAGGGEVHGSVVSSPSGEPVRGAFVRVGKLGAVDGVMAADLEANWGTLVRTDEHGRFRAVGLLGGPCPIVVRSAGFALFRGELEVVEGGSTPFQAALAPEAVLEGHVRDELGAPVSGVGVRVSDEHGPFRAWAQTKSDGSFRVGALESGRKLTAWAENQNGRARTEFLSEAGRTDVWEAVLDQGGSIHGRVEDELGRPLAGWTVRLEDAAPSSLESDQGFCETGADGGFVFANVHDRPHLVLVSAPTARDVGAPARVDVRPGPDELVLRVADPRMPSARIVGRFLDEEGRAIPTAVLLPVFAGWPAALAESCDPLTGRFDIGPLPAATVVLHLKAPKRGRLQIGPHELVAGETWDVGEVRLAPDGRLRVRLVPSGLDVSDSVELSAGVFSDPFEGTGAERLSPSLAPGRYTLFLAGGQYEELALAFEINSDVESKLDVPLRRGWRTLVAVRAPDSVAIVELRVSLPGGGVLERLVWERQDTLFVKTLHLPTGSLSVTATAGDFHASGTVVVEPVDRDEPTLVLALD